MAEWQLLSNHGRVLLLVAREPRARLRDIAGAVGITERTAHRIITELVEDGYVIRRRNGSRNEYEVRPDVAIHDPVLGERWVGEILAAVADSDGSQPRRRSGGGSGGPASGPPRALRAELRSVYTSSARRPASGPAP
jgi:Winged helix-turn-helix DNA-binding